MVGYENTRGDLGVKPEKSGTLAEIAFRLADQYADCRSMADNLRQLADKAYGPVPEPPVAVNGHKQPEALVELIHYHFNLIDEAHADIRRQLERLSSL